VEERRVGLEEEVDEARQEVVGADLLRAAIRRLGQLPFTPAMQISHTTQVYV
jgi:hypothetical protein